MDEMVKTLARDNPFASERVEALLPFAPEWLGETWSGLLDRLNGLDYRAAVVGPHGSGKTTLLEGMKTRLERQGFRVGSFFLNEERTRLSELEWRSLELIEVGEKSPVIFLDGAEQMPRRDWRRLLTLANRCRGLVTTQHQRGKLPLLVRTETRVEMLRQFAWHLAPGFTWDEGELERVYLHSKGNIREALWHCYDRVANGGVRQKS